MNKEDLVEILIVLALLAIVFLVYYIDNCLVENSYIPIAKSCEK